MRVLVTNDDGVAAPGLAVLARALHDAGHHLLVVAPLTERSGAGAAIGTLAAATRIPSATHRIEGLDGVAVHGLDAPPALCVIAARLGAFGDPPDVVVSGINPGLNTGRAILHSGTVGAVLTAVNHGLSGLAVSVAGSVPSHWDTAADLAVDALDWVLAAPLRTALNLNVPDRASAELRGICWAEPAALGEWQATITTAQPDHLEIGLRPTGAELPPETDTALVAAGYAAVTLIEPPRPADWAPVADHLERRLAARRQAENSAGGSPAGVGGSAEEHRPGAADDVGRSA